MSLKKAQWTTSVVPAQSEDLSVFSQEDLADIAWKLNARTRKSLGFKCCAKLFTPDAFDFMWHHAGLQP